MPFLEKLFYFIVSTCGFAAALIIHYLLVTKPTSNPNSSQSSSSRSTLFDPPAIRRSIMAYKPRGVVARAVYEKVHNDQYLDGYDMKLVSPILYILSVYLKYVFFLFQWYKLPKALAERFQSKFIALEEPDEITLFWLDEAKHLSANFWLQLWHIIARLFLTAFMTQTDVNGCVYFHSWRNQ